MKVHYLVVKESIKTRLCDACGGSGIVQRTFQGHKIKNRCSTCGGTGKQQFKQRTEITLAEALNEIKKQQNEN